MYGPVLDRLRDRFPTYAWARITAGMSGAATFRLQSRDSDRALYAKLATASEHPDARSDLVAEAARIGWLSTRGVPGPELVDSGARDGVQWLVMTGRPGRAASDPWPAELRGLVVDALADVLRALHDLPVADCPFDRTLDTALGNARHALEHGLVDELTAEVEEWKRSLDESALLAELTVTRPAVEDVVVCHGDYCLPNVLLDPATLAVTGLIDLGRLGRADRYADLGLMVGSIGSQTLNPQYDEEHAARFLDRYGADPSDPRLAFYRKLDLLF